MYFLRLLNIAAADSNMFFASIQPPHEGLSKLVFVEDSDDSLPLGLREGHGQARQLFLSVRNKKKSADARSEE
jgi:hypothetical protein